MIRFRGQRQEGFTLVELLIAIVIMGTAVSVLVVAMGSLTAASQQSKASAVAENLTHNFAEAIQNKVSYTTTLSASLTAAATPATITVADASGFASTPTASRPMDILIDQEVFTIKGVSGNVLTLATDGNNGRGEAGTVAGDHAAGASVLQYFICPVATSTSGTTSDGHVGYLTPDNFQAPKDVNNNVLASVSIPEVDYSLSATAGTFTSANNVSACINNYQTACPSNSFRPECDPGLARVDIRVTTLLPAGPNLTVDGWTMVRRGSN